MLAFRAQCAIAGRQFVYYSSSARGTAYDLTKQRQDRHSTEAEVEKREAELEASV